MLSYYSRLEKNNGHVFLVVVVLMVDLSLSRVTPVNNKKKTLDQTQMIYFASIPSCLGYRLLLATYISATPGDV